MKKLLIIASVMMAVAANAASFTWGFGAGEYYTKGGEELYTGTAFLYLGVVTATDSAFDTTGATLLAQAGFDDGQWLYGNYDTDNLSSNEALTSTAAGQAYSLILLEKEGVASLDGYEGNYFLVTGESDQGQLPGVTPVYYGSFNNDDIITTSMTMESVPEPTSGLLLLLGMAGLALKRKNA